MLGVLYGANIDSSEWKANSRYLLDPTKPDDSILRAAGKYGFTNLIIQAEAWYLKFLVLEVDNVVENLLHADCNAMKSLKKASMDFIVKNADLVVASDTYIALMETPTLLTEVVTAMAKQLWTYSEDDRKRKRSG